MRYLLRRLRRHMPDAVPIAIFWGYSGEEARAAEQIDCEVVTGLEQAVQKILAVVEPDRERAAIADDGGANKPAILRRSKILRRYAPKSLRNRPAMN